MNVDSTSINEMPSSSSFVDASTSKKMRVDNAQRLKTSWQKQRDKKQMKLLGGFLFVEDVPDVKNGNCIFS